MPLKLVTRAGSVSVLVFLIGYCLLLAYLSLSPLTDWTAPSYAPWKQVILGGLKVGSGLDLIRNILAYVPLGALIVWTRSRFHRGMSSILLATVSALVVSFVLECLQAYSPGRVPSILDVGLNTVGGLVGGLTAAGLSRGSELGRGAWYGVGVVVFVTAGTLLILDPGLLERPLDQERAYELPVPEDLPPVVFPAFAVEHPRLPAPSVEDVARLRSENPSFFTRHQERSEGGSGDLYSVILSAFVDPGSQDLELLHQRLMGLTFVWRGHGEVKPLALGYDWLYGQWRADQRKALAAKLVEGSKYIIYRIREEERLSPYNVYLYNSPFQALVAAAIAIYGDDPRGDPVMRFTHDYWNNRVLPVWRQVMGENGGWHEGGEYVGLGIGQAVYQVPAMWRRATGVDVFATETGIKGFLDFLVYRTRPDGSHIRWGDASVFIRDSPDRLALAYEYRQRAPYSLGGCPQSLEPTAWPWGPLSDKELCDPDAVARLPLERYFDGIGLMVARSDWSQDATYVTFKTGDNYWSHSHLDQGAFTIYRGGALAIDSGLYGPDYGSDHHLNYTYQTIAHNTITVTDPEDTEPSGGERPRRIANDGGQRRIGSGWGVEAAPLDRDEWEQKREIYQTGSMRRILQEAGLVVAVADVTPAYTNELSGKSTFSHRTRRVERFWRTFGYDRLDDVVVVFDRVVSSKPHFPKRWLLHTIEQPESSERGFVATIAPTQAPGHGGGSLYGTVLLPKNATIEQIGGEGYEYFVNGRNFDERGKIAEIIARTEHSEVGAWRIEVAPNREAEEDVFLVAMLPTSGRQRPPHVIQLLEDGERVGCQIVGPNRVTRWWFTAGRNGTRVDVVEGAETKSFDVTVE